MGIEENKSIVRKINNDELDLVEYLAEDVVWTIPGLKSFHENHHKNTCKCNQYTNYKGDFCTAFISLDDISLFFY